MPDLGSAAIIFPADPDDQSTCLALDPCPDGLPRITWLGPGGDLPVPVDPAQVVAAAGASGCSLLPEHWRSLYTRPALRGHRIRTGDTALPAAGRDWSTAFRTVSMTAGASRLRLTAVDGVAGLGLSTEIEAVPGGALRIRHTITNTGSDPYVLDGLDVVVPVPDTHAEVLDFTGRHERERSPQRHVIGDGLWLREGRDGRTGLDAAMMAVTGPAGFSFADASVLALHVAWSGNSVLRVERGTATGTTLGGGELLLPGEMVLTQSQSYSSPWVHVIATSDGLDGVAAGFHQWLRSLPAHPTEQKSTLNVWEAVYFRHALAELKHLADLASRVGVERFVLDDGWFTGRRNDLAGLGDWDVDADVWPQGLGPLIDHVRGLNIEFGLWFEPEMVNPDSNLFREHPDWVLSSGDRQPLLQRNQLVLDLSREDVRSHLFQRLDAILSAYDIGFVKWDHNRDLLEAGSGARSGAPAVHAQTLGFYRLLDDLAARHPEVVWESCASGGGRIDLGVLERAQRVWASDMTDALSRQAIQRWTVQLVAPEYIGAHVSAPTAHQTGRTLPLDFRAATALFGAFGIEWDLTTATHLELEALAEWVALFHRRRRLLHTGRTVRIDSPDPAVWLHGVVAADGSEALFAHVQLDESTHNRGVRMRMPGLDPQRLYLPRWDGPVDESRVSRAAPVPEIGPTGGVAVSGTLLARQGVWIPRRNPETILLVHLAVADGASGPTVG